MDTLADLQTPIFWAEGHPGPLERDSWELQIIGACLEPQTFTWAKLMLLPSTTVEGRLTSVTRWSVNGEWEGVTMKTLLEAVKAKPSVKYLRFWSVGLTYDTSIPIDIALLEKSLVAWKFNGEYLTEDYGGPIRGFVPYLWGYKSAKSIVKIELLDHYIPGFWEKRGYTDSAEIEAGPCRDMNDGGEFKQIPGGEVLRFLEED